MSGPFQRGRTASACESRVGDGLIRRAPGKTPDRTGGDMPVTPAAGHGPCRSPTTVRMPRGGEAGRRTGRGTPSTERGVRRDIPRTGAAVQARAIRGGRALAAARAAETARGSEACGRKSSGAAA